MSDVGTGAAGGAGIGGLIGGPVGAGIGAGIGAIGGGIADFFGQQSANNLNWDEFVSNQQFDQTEIANAQQYNTAMSNTSWQRGVADMKAAGINPILAASQGGASSPTSPTLSPGTGAPMQNTMGGLGRAIGGAIPDALTAANTLATVKNTEADTALSSAKTLTEAAQAQKTATDAKLTGETLNQMTARRDQNAAQADRDAAQAIWEKQNMGWRNILNSVGTGMGIFNNASQSIKNLIPNASQKALDAGSTIINPYKP